MVERGERCLFYLGQKTKSHEKGIRSCCVIKKSEKIVTASWGGDICVWAPFTPSENSLRYSGTSNYPYSVQYQYTICVGPIYCVIDGLIKESPTLEDTFFAGCTNDIYWNSIKGNTLYTFKGHAGPVSSLMLTQVPCDKQSSSIPVLVSGSWDSTARIWNLQDRCLLYTLSGHSHAVAAYARACLSKTYIITGSQDRTLRWWSSESNFRAPIALIPDAHQDIIRGFAQLLDTQLCTCSNDGYVNVWDTRDYKKLGGYKLHDSFIFDIAVIPGFDRNNGDVLLASTSEDGTTKIWNPLAKPWILLQTLEHPSTVWKMAVLYNQDIVTVCDDTALRVWTRNEREALPEKERNNDLQESLLGKTKTKKIDVNSLPRKSSLPRGEFYGQTKLCREGYSVIAMKWENESWHMVGEVVQTPESSCSSEEYYQGDAVFPAGLYDYIFHVEIETSASSKPLPFRRGGDAEQAAQLFCVRENISKAHIETIVKFIKANCDQCVQNIPRIPVREPEPVREFVLHDYVSFSSVNVVGIRSKLDLINKLDTTQSELHKEYLECLLKKIELPNFINVTLRKCEIDAVFNKKATMYPDEHLLPIVDLWRILVLHPECSDAFKVSESAWSYINVAQTIISKSYKEPTSLTLCCYRFLANFFVLSTSRAIILRYTPEVVKILELSPSGKQAVIFAWNAVLINLTVALSESTSNVFKYMIPLRNVNTTMVNHVSSSLVRGVLNILKKEKLSIQMLHSLSLILGTIAVSTPSIGIGDAFLSPTGLFREAVLVLQQCAHDVNDEDLDLCVNHLLTLCKS